jgi:Na+/melibiose symporter-like transporter
MKLDYKKTFLIGFGFFASSLAWSLYNSFVPVMLEERFLMSTAIIGLIMTIDNFFGVVFQPLVGMLSDRTHTRIGKRMPWILFGIPACAAAFILIPRSQTLIAMMTIIIAFNFIMSLWRSPVVALMPDVTPSPLRSKANGVINLMGGVGSIIAFFIGGTLANKYGDNAPFLMGGLVMVFALAMLIFFVREPDSRRPHLNDNLLENKPGLAASIIQNLRNARQEKRDQPLKVWAKGEKRSLAFLLFAIFFWFCGYNAVETFFTLYATKELNMSKGSATMTLTLFSLSFVAFALPAGLIAGKLGRKKVILTGLVGIIAAFVPMLFVSNILVLRLLLLAGGLFWAFININSLPMVVEMASRERIGSYTGYYYFFSFSAAIASPILFGVIRDLTDDYGTLFVYAAISFAAALACMLLVRHGESKKEAAL